MKVVTQHFIGTTEEWERANPKLYKAVWGFEKTSEGRILAKLGNGEDKWNNLKYFDEENIRGLPEKLQGILSNADNISASLQKEKQDRQAADQVLQSNIDKETADRKAADQVLQSNIDTSLQKEKQDRQAADQVLQEKIDIETADRQAIIQTIQNNIDNEAANRQLEDQNIREAIRLLAPEGLEDIPQLIRDEASARHEADQMLQNNIDNESQARTAAIQAHNENANAHANILIPVNNIDFPVGWAYEQKPSDPTPAEAGLRGTWLQWNERAETYEMITEAAYTALFSAVPVSWTASATIAAGQYRIWTPKGNTASGTRRIIKSNTAITSQSPLAMNPIHWDNLSGRSYESRRTLQNNVWNNDDLAIGAQVTHNGAAKRIVGIITMSGLFPSYAGGNRPNFNAGVSYDRTRRLQGNYGRLYGEIEPTAVGGIFEGIYGYGTKEIEGPWLTGYLLGLDSSRVVPYGNDNAPVTLSSLYWRRVS